MNMQASSILKGMLTFVPGITRVMPGIGLGTGGTDSARYCYGVWLKYLTLLHENGMHAIPGTIAELGPGDSLGIGLAAMLSGAALAIICRCASIPALASPPMPGMPSIPGIASSDEVAGASAWGAGSSPPHASANMERTIAAAMRMVFTF